MIAISYRNNCKGCDNTCCGSICPERYDYEDIPDIIQKSKKIKEKSYSKFVGKSPFNLRKKKK